MCGGGMEFEKHLSAKDAKKREVKTEKSRFGFSSCPFASFADKKMNPEL
jgi:hypothetical protein